MTHIGPSEFQLCLNLLPGLYIPRKRRKNHYDLCAYWNFDHIGTKADFLSVSSWTDGGPTWDLYFTVLNTRISKI